MRRDRRTAGAEIRHDLADPVPAATQQTENSATRQVRNRPEYRLALPAV
jgi:hypothetical protein